LGGRSAAGGSGRSTGFAGDLAVEPRPTLWQALHYYDDPQLSASFHEKSYLIKLLNGIYSVISIQAAGFIQAEVAKLVYALDLGSSAARCESSSLSFRTKLMAGLPSLWV
jgi:hypothetical protein